MTIRCLTHILAVLGVDNVRKIAKYEVNILLENTGKMQSQLFVKNMFVCFLLKMNNIQVLLKKKE